MDIPPQDTLRDHDPQMETGLRLMDELLAQAPPKPTFPPRPDRSLRARR